MNFRERPESVIDGVLALRTEAPSRRLYSSGPRAFRSGALEIIMRPENGRLSSNIQIDCTGRS